MGDCCSSCAGEKEKGSEISMKSLNENRMILVVDVEDDDNLIERHDSSMHEKWKRKSDIKREKELEDKVDQWFAQPDAVKRNGRLSIAEAAHKCRKSLKEEFQSPRGHAIIDGTFLAMSLNDEFISKEELVKELKQTRRTILNIPGVE